MVKKAKGRRYIVKFKYVGSPEIYERSYIATSREMAEQRLRNMDWHKPIRIVH
jgi:hypothetical protein